MASIVKSTVNPTAQWHLVKSPLAIPGPPRATWGAVMDDRALRSEVTPGTILKQL